MTTELHTANKKDAKKDAVFAAIASKYDRNGDGKFGISEVKLIYNDLLAEKTHSRRGFLLAAALTLLLTISVGANFASSFAAMELAKEVKTDSEVGILKTKGGGDVVVADQSIGGVSIFPPSRRSLRRRGLSTHVEVAEVDQWQCKKAKQLIDARRRVSIHLKPPGGGLRSTVP